GKGDRLLDTSGHGNHGTIHGAEWVKGRVGGGLRFDGVDDYVTVPKSAALNSINKEITLMCRIKTPLSGRYSILERWPCDNTSQRCLELDVDSEGKIVHFALSPTGTGGTWCKSSKTVPADKWVHIAVTSNGKIMRIYINGQPASSDSVPESPKIHQSTADLHIGVWHSDNKSDHFFKGTMDEISIYSRALTREEILESYLAGVPKGTVAGKIISKSGNPIEGAKVSVGPFRSDTDRQGRYRIAVPAGTFDVNVHKKHYKSRAKLDIKVKADETTTTNIVLATDKTPPSISDVKTEDINGVSATILWKTNEKCRGIIRYGTSSGKYSKAAKGPLYLKTRSVTVGLGYALGSGVKSHFNKTKKRTFYVKSHRITLTGLAGGVKYYFIVESTDSAGNATKSKEYTLTTRKVEHPRLIVRKSDYPAMRARAARSPWKEMKAEAVSYMEKNSYSPKKDEFVGRRYSRMSSVVRNGALAYILDPENKTLYRDKIADALSAWDKLYVHARDWTGHNGQYYLNADWQAAFFNSVLALDVIYNDLSPAQRDDLESKLDTVADWYYRRSGSVYHFANYGLWAIYKGDRRRIDSAKTRWRADYSRWFSSDGVFYDGPGYAICSANSRHGKMHFHHILEFAGEDNTWYSDPQIDGFYEWLYGAGFSPFYRVISFADTGP
ncbi:MAG: carboxypeptidase regulatory-like domain-containing protein, partial [Phycisphaerae bacterium]|nr:carboxypeptidase regulatory-like domain-containing protein [Phycisphaerae bacterium]